MDARQREIEELRRKLGLVEPTTSSVEDGLKEEPSVEPLITDETKQKVAKATEQGKVALAKAVAFGAGATAQAKAVREKIRVSDFKSKLPHPSLSRSRLKGVGVFLAVCLVGTIGWFFVGLLSSSSEVPEERISVPTQVPALAEGAIAEQKVFSEAPQDEEAKAPMTAVAKPEVQELAVQSPVTEPAPVEQPEPREQVMPQPKPVVPKVEKPKSAKPAPSQRKPQKQETQERSWQDKANEDIERFLEQQQ